MPKLSAGLLVFRKSNEIEVFLVHPGGPFWAKKDAGAWSIPKGEYDQAEDAFDAAKREFKEETSIEAPAGDARPLGEVKYNNKLLTVWAVEGGIDATAIKSNYFEMQWPPKSGKIEQFPEVDKAGWFTLVQAKTKLVAGQVPFIDTLAELLDVAQAEPEEQLALF